MFNTLDFVNDADYMTNAELEEMLPADPMGWNDETADEYARHMGW